MGDQVFIEFLTQLPLHGLLLVAVVVLYRDNQQLRKQIETVRQVSSGNTAILLNQNEALNTIQAQVTGLTPPKGIKPIEPYSASPPYRKQ